ncbi:MAG: ribonuclease P protein component [Magnetospirillum sp. WYHS-4]
MTTVLARLKRRVEFLRVADARRKWVAPGLILQVRRRASGDFCPGGEAAIRVGFTVSRKVGNAVVRNRARRRLRAVAEAVLPVAARPGYDFVLIGRGGTIGRPFPELLEDLKKALARLGAETEPSKGLTET